MQLYKAIENGLSLVHALVLAAFVTHVASAHKEFSLVSYN